MDFPERNTAIVIGDFEFDRKPFKERGIEAYKVSVEAAPNAFNIAKALIVAALPGQFGLIRECCSKIYPYAEDHGLALAVLVRSGRENPKRIQKHFRRSNFCYQRALDRSRIYRAAPN
jgi:hypothetical protein